MKRYRVVGVTFDFRANVLGMSIPDHWDETVKAAHRAHQAHVREAVLAEYGEADSEVKLRNLIDLRAAPVSIVADHNELLEAARSSFIGGYYYPALLSACALGERILNHLMLDLRDDYRGRPGHRDVATIESSSNWRQLIDLLSGWGVLRPEVTADLRTLKRLRNASVHFSPGIEKDLRPRALSALRLVSHVIERQFGAFGDLPWFIPNDLGLTFLRKAAEAEPLVRRYYLPCSVLVSPWHEVDFVDGGVIARDLYSHAEGDITDSRFVELVRQGPTTSASPGQL